ncbi:coatomer subunit delta-like protein [Tanacetum coccineum]
MSIVIPLGYPLKGNGSKPEHLRLGSVDTYINLLLFVAADYQNETEVGEALAEAFKTSLVKRGPFTDASRLSPTCANMRGYTQAAQTETWINTRMQLLALAPLALFTHRFILEYDSRNPILEWSLLLIDDSNRTGSMEFIVPPFDTSTIFPTSVIFSTTSTLSNIKVVSIVPLKDGAAPKFTQRTQLVTKSY